MTSAAAPPPPPARPRRFDHLGGRLAFLLAVALFPLLVLAAMQSRSMLLEARARSEAALMGETLRAVAEKTRLIQQVRSEAALLAQLVVPVIDNEDACNLLMRRAKGADDHASFFGYVPLDGQLRCSSEGGHYDMSDNALFQRLVSQSEPSFSVSAYGRVSQTSILSVSHPVQDDTGERVGFVTVSLPHSEFALTDQPGAGRFAALGGTERLAPAEGARQPDMPRPLLIITFDATGRVLTASGGGEETLEKLPLGYPLAALGQGSGTTITATSQTGEHRIYAVVDLIPGQLYALGSRPADTLASLGMSTWFEPFLFPALMWAASLFIAYFAMQKLVIGHIRRLSRALNSFASGNRIVGDLDFEGAPREIRDLAQTYEKMTETILHDEAELEDMVHHKEVLLREVHHRVKNNLQLIVSIINMQVRRARTPEAKAMMKGLQDRVLSLATVHRGLYMTTGLTDVNANELLRDIVRQLMRAVTGPDRRLTVETAIDPIQMTPDQAVPLSLLVTEATTNAIKYASADVGNPVLSVALHRQEGNRARLEIRNTVAAAGPNPATPAQEEESGLGLQLVGAFVQQLGGTLLRENQPGFYRITVDFDIRPLNEAEMRHDEAARDG